jgi:hypothetical protein
MRTKSKKIKLTRKILRGGIAAVASGYSGSSDSGSGYYVRDTGPNCKRFIERDSCDNVKDISKFLSNSSDNYNKLTQNDKDLFFHDLEDVGAFVLLDKVANNELLNNEEFEHYNFFFTIFIAILEAKGYDKDYFHDISDLSNPIQLKEFKKHTIQAKIVRKHIQRLLATSEILHTKISEFKSLVKKIEELQPRP